MRFMFGVFHRSPPWHSCRRLIAASWRQC